MFFIVSQVEVKAAAGEVVTVTVSRAEGEKCQRCWRVVPDVSHVDGSDGLCSRCIAALAADAPRAAR
jgi:isoleucyl-tRNA synthetase